MQKLKAPIQIKFSCGGENNVKNQIILLSRDPPLLFIDRRWEGKWNWVTPAGTDRYWRKRMYALFAGVEQFN